MLVFIIIIFIILLSYAIFPASYPYQKKIYSFILSALSRYARLNNVFIIIMLCSVHHDYLFCVT